MIIIIQKQLLLQCEIISSVIIIVNRNNSQ